MKVKDIEAQIARHYPRYIASRGSQTSTPLPHALKSYLRQEMTNRYTLPGIQEWIDSQSRVCSLTYDNKLTIHQITDGFACLWPEMTRWANRAMCLITMYHITKPINIYLLPYESLRQLPPLSTPIAPAHINGGFTLLDNSDTITIFVYRKQEMSKVIIHEIMHHTRFAQPNTPWSDDTLQALANIFRIDLISAARMRPSEAIVEAMANIHHALFISYETNIPAATLLELETIHALQQAQKIAMHQKTLPNQTWTEHTDAWSYYYLRAIILLHHDAFLRSQIPIHPNAVTRFIIDHASSLEDAFKKHRIRRTDRQMRMTLLGDW